MNILITGASTRISNLIATALTGQHSVTLTDRVPSPGLDNFVQCDLDHDPSTNDLVRGMDVVIHSGQVDPGLPVSEQLDGGMRCVYNLVRAAAKEGVPRVVFLSSLSVMGRYDEEYVVTERWLPSPTTETDVLCFHLGSLSVASSPASSELKLYACGSATSLETRTITSLRPHSIRMTRCRR